MKNFGFAAVTMVAVCTLFSSNAVAERYHVSTGDVCHAAHGSAIDTFSYVVPTGIRNPSSSALEIECPLPVHIRNGYVAVVGAGFSFVDLSSTDQVTCTLYGVAHNGYINVESAEFATGNSFVSSAGIEADFDPTYLGYLEGFWRMRCRLPAATTNGQSGINTFWLITSDS